MRIAVRISLSTAFLTVFLLDPLIAQKNIKVIEITAEKVNIRTSGSTNSTVLCQAIKGETFIYKNTVGNWYEFVMYSGNYRYVHKSTAQIIKTTDIFSLTDRQVKRLVSELGKIEDKAAQVSGNWNYTTKFIDQERELIDCYKLKYFRESNIATHLHGAILEYAVENNLLW